MKLKSNVIEKYDSGTTLTYGTFDLFHYGHIALLSRAADLGLPLLVGVSTSEFNAMKGKSNKHSFEIRCSLLNQLKCVDQIFPEENWEQKIDDIKKYNAKYLVMGDDWRGKFDHLNIYTKVVYLPRTPEVSSTLIRKLFS
jgi:glycerol-3-phosphate cytidylyltransferase